MKLLFPNGEHGQALLNSGVTRIGADKDNHVILNQPGIAPRHCEIRYQAGSATVRAADGSPELTLNGKPVQGEEAMRPGDLLGIGAVQARVVAVERASSTPVARPAVVDDSGATRVRQAIPKFVLRGVSGAAFGKTYPIYGQTVIGRQHDCDLAIASEEISRRHAQVKPTPDGLLVEDLGSSNGTYINGKRVQQGLLKPGEELRLDTIRFMLIAPGTEMAAASRTVQAAPATAAGGSRTGLVVGIVLALLAAGGAAAWFFLR